MLRFFFLLICLGSAGFIVYRGFQIITASQVLSAQIISPVADTISTSDAPKKVAGSLQQAVADALQGTKGTYGVVIMHLATKENYKKDQDKTFEAASLYKLWIMATVYTQIENGQLKEDDVLTQNISVLNQKFRIASGDAELTRGTISLTVEEALEKMITVSDNYAAMLLTEEIRLSQVALFLKKHEFTQSSVGTDGSTPTTTPLDTALFFEKLYNGELADKTNTEKMITLLKNQRLNNKLPKYLKKGTIIAHKTGELGMFTHDAGIVYTPKGNYIIAVLSESDIPKAAEDRIANISLNVFNYFNK